MVLVVVLEQVEAVAKPLLVQVLKKLPPGEEHQNQKNKTKTKKNSQKRKNIV